MKKHIGIVKHYEKCFIENGDNHKGMDWPNEKDQKKRFEVMLDLVYFNKDSSVVSVLDFGCGTAHLLEYINQNDYKNIIYSGSDLSEIFIKKAKEKHPNLAFYCEDILEGNESNKNYDYIFINGVFTEKINFSFDDMFMYFQKMIKKLYDKCTKGIAFNVMSANVDWERDDLFHLKLDQLTLFLRNEISNKYVVRNDYGLYEYTVYIYK